MKYYVLFCFTISIGAIAFAQNQIVGPEDAELGIFVNNGGTVAEKAVVSKTGTLQVDNITNLAGSADPTFPNGLQLDDDANQDTLNYYESHSYSGTNWALLGGGDCAGATCTIFIQLRRIGTAVIVSVRFSVVGTTGASPTIVGFNDSSGSWPSRFHPSATTTQYCYVKQPSGSGYHIRIVYSASVWYIALQRDGGGGFPSSSDTEWLSCTYTIF